MKKVFISAILLNSLSLIHAQSQSILEILNEDQSEVSVIAKAICDVVNELIDGTLNIMIYGQKTHHLSEVANEIIQQRQSPVIL